MNVIKTLAVQGLVNKKASRQKVKGDLFASIFEAMKKQPTVAVNDKNKNLNLSAGSRIQEEFREDALKNSVRNPLPSEEKATNKKISEKSLPEFVFHGKTPLFSQTETVPERKSPVRGDSPGSGEKKNSIVNIPSPESGKVLITNPFNGKIAETKKSQDIHPLTSDKQVHLEKKQEEGNPFKGQVFLLNGAAVVQHSTEKTVRPQDDKLPGISQRSEKEQKTGKSNTYHIETPVAEKQIKREKEIPLHNVHGSNNREDRRKIAEKPLQEVKDGDRIGSVPEPGENFAVQQRATTISVFQGENREELNRRKTLQDNGKTVERPPVLTGRKNEKVEDIKAYTAGTSRENQHPRQNTEDIKTELQPEFKQELPVENRVRVENKTGERFQVNLPENRKENFRMATAVEPDSSQISQNADHRLKSPLDFHENAHSSHTGLVQGKRDIKKHLNRKSIDITQHGVRDNHHTVKDDRKIKQEMADNFPEHQTGYTPPVSEREQNVKNHRMETAGGIGKGDTVSSVTSNHHSGNGSTGQDSGETEGFYHASGGREEIMEDRNENSFHRNLTLNLKLDGLSLRARYNGMKLDLSLMLKDVGNIQIHQLSGELSQIIQESGIENYILRIRDREKEYRAFSEGKKAIHQTSNKEINVRA